MKTKEELRVILKELDKPEYLGLSDNEAAQKMNALTEAAYGDVSNQDVLRELPAMSNTGYGGAFVWDVVKTAAAYAGQNAAQLAAKDIANRLLFTFESKLPINMGGKSFETLSVAAIQAGFFTQEQLLILKNLGKTMTSRSKVLGLSTITPDDIANARKL